MSDYIHSQNFAKQRERELLAGFDSGWPLHRRRRVRTETLIRLGRLAREARARASAWMRALRPDDETKRAAPARQNADEPCWGC